MNKSLSNFLIALLVAITIWAVLWFFKTKVNDPALRELINIQEQTLERINATKPILDSLGRHRDTLLIKDNHIVEKQPLIYEKYNNQTYLITSASDSEQIAYWPTLEKLIDSLDASGFWYDEPKAYRAIPVTPER